MARIAVLAALPFCLAGHIRQLGFTATAHVASASWVDVERLTVLAGLAVRDGDRLRNPFIDRGFSLAVVTTDYELATDRPLAASALNARDLRYWLGRNGAVSGRERNRRDARASHLGPYPMETVRRIERPTTLILDDEVPQVSKRAAFFERALRGDLGEKSRNERHRFAFKQPHTAGMLPLHARHGRPPGRQAEPGRRYEPLTPTQWPMPGPSSRCPISSALTSPASARSRTTPGTRMAPTANPSRPGTNMPSLWSSTRNTTPWEGASGDDWISGSQSMRAYLRGAEIAGVMAEHVRQLGFAARSQTNVDSDVLHLPLMLLAGLGELSRIGELVLNPFVGPRLKTVVVTTDMPLEPDKPIDFGLQYFCSNCWKCARECPCDAISWGNKVMFNGYEMWKPGR